MKSLLPFFLFIFAYIPPNSVSQEFDFSRADAHALSAPEHYEQSLENLVDFLITPFNSEAEKARVIFRWITDSIEYDTRAYFTGSTGSVTPRVVIQKGTATCTGYSQLFKEMATLAGLEAIIINGHSKGYSFNQEKENWDSNHAWNAIRIDGQWKLVDTTWGAGYINQETGTFRKNFDSHYFFTNPTEFIFDHFPEDPAWQLLETPLSLDEYKQLVHVKPAFFRHGLALYSHPTAKIETTGPTRIILRVPQESVLTARLSRNESHLPVNQVFVHHTSDKAIIDVTPPQRGHYELEIYAKEYGSLNPVFEWVLSYSITSNRESADSGYPEAFAAFINNRGMVNEPTDFILNAGEEIYFSLVIPTAASVSVVNNDKWTDLNNNDGIFSGYVTPLEGTVRIAASFDGSQQYGVLLEYLAK